MYNIYTIFLIMMELKHLYIYINSCLIEVCVAGVLILLNEFFAYHINPNKL